MKKGNTKTLAARPDAEIDTGDMPEMTDFSGAVRGLFARPETRHISIRLSAEDLVTATRLAAAKGLPYQTYIKSLLHESLERESEAHGRLKSRCRKPGSRQEPVIERFPQSLLQGNRANATMPCCSPALTSIIAALGRINLCK